MGITVSSHSTDPNYVAIKADTLAKNAKFASSSVITTTTYYNYSGGQEVMTEGFQAEITLNSIQEFLGQAVTSYPSQVYMVGTDQNHASVTINNVSYPLAFAFSNQLTPQDFQANIWVSESILSDVSNLSGRSIKIFNNNQSGGIQVKSVVPGNGMFVENTVNNFFTAIPVSTLKTNLPYNKVYPQLDTNSAALFANATNYNAPGSNFIAFVDPTVTFSQNSEIFLYIGSAVHQLSQMNSPLIASSSGQNDVSSILQLGIFYRITWLQYETNKVLS